MTEKESKKVKRRTGKLLSSFVVLAIVLSVLAVTMLPASATPPTVTRTIVPDTVDKGGVVDVTIEFTTTEDMGFFPALQDVVPEGWVATDLSAVPDVTASSFTDHTVGFIWGTLGSGVDVTASYKLHVPVDAAGGDYPLNGALYKMPDLDPYADVTGDDTVTVTGPVYGVELTVTPEEQTVLPNVNATYTLTVKNTGNIGDTFDIAIDNVPAGATATLSEGVTPELVPDGTYDISLNVSSAIEDEYIVNVTATSQGDPSKSDKVTTKTNVSLDLPDLIVTEITPNCDYLFANESNKINATIKNNGTAAADAFNVSFVIDGFSEEVRIAAGLAPGANTTRCVTDPTLRNAGDLVSINVTADCNGEVSELNETNNWMNISTTVVNNGYKGKRYTGGANITTWQFHDQAHINLTYSTGDSEYQTGYNTLWTTYTANWTASDLPIPSGATIKKAALNTYYTFDRTPASNVTDYFTLTFNGNVVPIDQHYSDRKGYGSWNYPYGLIRYNVTADFVAGGSNNVDLNDAEPTTPHHVSLSGMMLMVVYEHADEPTRMIWINEGFDIISARTTYCVTSEEATAYAPFTGGTIPDNMSKATLITVMQDAFDGDDKNRLYFNGGEWHGIWDTAAKQGDTTIAINETDVFAYLNATDNEARLQSHIPEGETQGDGMGASKAILVVEEVPPEKTIEYNLTKKPDSTGKNWISIPLNTTITNASSLMAAIGPNCDAVNRWNATTQQPEGWISQGGGMGTNFDIVRGEGYEISVTANTTFNQTGERVSIGPISLIKKPGSTGKNWIGLPYDTILTNASSLMAAIGSNCDAVNRWNATTQQPEGWISQGGGMGTNFDIVRGEGYEISVTANTTWTPV